MIAVAHVRSRSERAHYSPGSSRPSRRRGAVALGPAALAGPLAAPSRPAVLVRYARYRVEECAVSDGPLIVQSDKTLLLEVDHPAAAEARVAIAPFAELERAPEHVHTYRVTPLALWNARAAGHDAEQVVDALVRFSRYAVPQPLLVDVVDTMGRYGRLQLTNSPVHGLVLVALDRAVLEEVLRQKKIAPLLGHPARPGHGAGAPVRARAPQAGPAQDRLAGRGPGRLRRRRGAPHRAGRGRLVPARLPAPGRGRVLGRRLRGGGAAVRGGQDDGRRGRDGGGQGDHPDPGHQHRGRPAVEAGADGPHQPDRGARSASTPANARRSGRSPSPPIR